MFQIQFREKSTGEIYSLSASEEETVGGILARLLEENPKLIGQHFAVYLGDRKLQPGLTLGDLLEQGLWTGEEIWELRLDTTADLSDLAQNVGRGASPDFLSKEKEAQIREKERAKKKDSPPEPAPLDDEVYDYDETRQDLHVSDLESARKEAEEELDGLALDDAEDLLLKEEGEESPEEVEEEPFSNLMGPPNLTIPTTEKIDDEEETEDDFPSLEEEIDPASVSASDEGLSQGAPLEEEKPQWDDEEETEEEIDVSFLQAEEAKLSASLSETEEEVQIDDLEVDMDEEKEIEGAISPPAEADMDLELEEEERAQEPPLSYSADREPPTPEEEKRAEEASFGAGGKKGLASEDLSRDLEKPSSEAPISYAADEAVPPSEEEEMAEEVSLGGGDEEENGGLEEKSAQDIDDLARGDVDDLVTLDSDLEDSPAQDKELRSLSESLESEEDDEIDEIDEIDEREEASAAAGGEMPLPATGKADHQDRVVPATTAEEPPSDKSEEGEKEVAEEPEPTTSSAGAPPPAPPKKKMKAKKRARRRNQKAPDRDKGTPPGGPGEREKKVASPPPPAAPAPAPAQPQPKKEVSSEPKRDQGEPEPVAKPKPKPQKPKPEPVEVAEGTKLKRQTTVRYYSQMHPFENFPLLVVISRAEIEKAQIGGVVQKKSKEAFEVKKVKPIVKIVPHFPGCLCTPSQMSVNVTPETVEAKMWLTPLCEDELEDARVEIWYDGKKVNEVQTPCRVTTQTVTKFMAGLGLLAPFAASILQAFELDPESQIRQGFPLVKTLVEILNYPYITILSLLFFAGLAGFFYYKNRALEADPVTEFFGVKAKDSTVQEDQVN